MDTFTSLLSGTLATFIPLFIGLFLPSRLARGYSSGGVLLLAGVSSGVIFWFFLDVMGDAALLDVNRGFGGDFTHVVLALLFAIGLVALFELERRSGGSAPSGAETLGGSAMLTFGVAAAAALGIGFHALAEGIQIGSIIPSAPSILAAIGGLGAGGAYVLHKLLEGFVIGVFALLARASTNRKLTLLGLISGVPTVIGFFAGIPGKIETTYFFALGGAGAVYIELRLIPIISRKGLGSSSVLSILLGFYFMYLAGLLHA